MVNQKTVTRVVTRGYMSDGLFKLNIITIVPNLAFNNNNTSSVYIAESSFLWYGRLGHDNFNYLRRLVDLECLPNFEFDPNHKCEICVGKTH